MLLITFFDMIFKTRLFFFALLLSLLTACGIDQSDPNAVAKEYVEAVYYANVKRFKQVVEPKDHKANDDHELFVTKESTGKSNTREARGDISLISVDDTYVKDGRARVRISVEFNNGERRILSISLHQNEGDWYVNPTTWARW